MARKEKKNVDNSNVDFYGLVEKSICSMFMDDKWRPFAVALMPYNFVVTNNTPMNTCCVLGDTIYINPGCFLFNDEDKKNSSIFVLLHEIMHPLFLDFERRKQRDPYIWNIAMDFSINYLIKVINVEYSQNTKNDFTKIDMEKIIKLGVCYHEDFDNMLAEEIYDILMKHAKIKKNSYSFNMIGGKGGTGGKDGKDDKDGENGENNGSGEGKGNEDNKENEEGNGNNSMDCNATEIEIDYKGMKFNVVYIESKNPINVSKEMQDHEKYSRNMVKDILSKGNETGRFSSILKRVFSVKIDFQKVLSEAILAATEKNDEVSWSDFSYVYMVNAKQLAFPLPGIETNDIFGSAVISIDESGSMSNDDVCKAIYVVNSLSNHFKGIYVIKHDCEVHWTKFYPEVIDESDIKELLERRHCGGTSHEQVFKELNKFKESENCENNLISLYIGITDLCSDVEQTQKIIDRSIPRVWICNSDIEIPCIEGEIIRL